MQSSEYNLFSSINTDGVTVADTFNTWRKSTNGIIQKLTVEAGSPTWDTSGKVVIGAAVTNGNAAIVDIGVARTGSGAAILNLGSVAGDNNVVINRASGTNGTFTVTNNGTGLFSLSQDGVGAISILTSATERVRVTAAGLVGIGAPFTATELLHVNGGNFKVSGTINSAAITSSSTIGGTNITASGYLYANTLGVGTSNTAFTVSQAGAIVGTALNAGNGTIQTTGAITGGAITGTSLVSSGGLAAGGAITGVTTIQTTGAITGGAITGTSLVSSGTITAGGDITAFSTSDRKFKDNITNITDPLDKVAQINGVSFDWNDKQSTFSGHDIGVIAQEVEAVLPEIVTIRDDGSKAVKYDKMVALLIECVKELSAKVERLENVAPN
jgi:hypothetical protein